MNIIDKVFDTTGSPSDRMRFKFWKPLTPAIVVEAPSFFIARQYARIRLQSSELHEETVKAPVARDCAMRWDGVDLNGGSRKLFINERIDCAFVGWREVSL